MSDDGLQELIRSSTPRPATPVDAESLWRQGQRRNRRRRAGVTGALASVLVVAVAAATTALVGGSDERVRTGETASRGSVETPASQSAAPSETGATRLEPDGEYCDGRTGAEVTAEALSISGSDQPENEGAWVMTTAGLAALDPDLHKARTDDDAQDEQVFVVPVADGGGQRLEPSEPAVTVDDRTGHTGVVVLDCAGGHALRLFPDGFFPFGEPGEFLDQARWFSDWTAPDGRAATHKQISDFEYKASDHCSWPNVRMLWFAGVQYVKDPDGVLGEQSYETAVDLDAELPGDAVDTGFEKAGTELWISAPEQPGAAYLVGPERTEQWPAATEPIACG